MLTQTVFLNSSMIVATVSYLTDALPQFVNRLLYQSMPELEMRGENSSNFYSSFMPICVGKFNNLHWKQSEFPLVMQHEVLRTVRAGG